MRTENRILERVIAAYAAIQQIHRIFMAQVRRYSVHARSAATLGAAGIRVEHHVPCFPLLTGLDIRRRGVIFDAMLTTEYIKIAEYDARDIRRSISIRIPAFSLKKTPCELPLLSAPRRPNKKLTFLLLFFVLLFDDFLCATLTVEFLTVTVADLLLEVT
jgi:hypothetical protein